MKRSSSWIAVLPSLVIPVCLGMTMYLGLSYLINEQQITNETVLRYLTGHPVSKVTVGMFFIGLASLLMIAGNVFGQFSGQKQIVLDIEDEEESERVKSLDTKDQAYEFGVRLKELPTSLRTHYLWQRLQNALHSVYRKNSASEVEDELKYLAELDLDEQQQRYSLVRILIWATPMLGFLGTVLGISQALGGINVGGDNNFQTMMDGLRGSLYVAFDTTALALTLSMLLMFGQFLVDRFESQLLLLVDQRAQSEINRNFVLTNGNQQQRSAFEATVETLNLLSGKIEASTIEANKNQTEVWRKTIQAAQQAWASTLTDANMQVQSNMSEAIDENVANLAHYLGEAIEKADLAMSHRWQQWQVTLSENARLLHQHHSQLAEQTLLLHDLMGKVNQPDSTSQKTAGSSNSPVVVSSSRFASDQLEAKKPLVKLKSRKAQSTVEVAPGVEVAEPKIGQPKTKPVLSEIVMPESKTNSALAEPVDMSQKDEEPRIINFQSYLNSTLAKSTQAKHVEVVKAVEQVVLPFAQANKSKAVQLNQTRTETGRLKRTG